MGAGALGSPAGDAASAADQQDFQGGEGRGGRNKCTASVEPQKPAPIIAMVLVFIRAPVSTLLIFHLTRLFYCSY